VVARTEALDDPVEQFLPELLARRGSGPVKHVVDVVDEVVRGFQGVQDGVGSRRVPVGEPVGHLGDPAGAQVRRPEPGKGHFAHVLLGESAEHDRQPRGPVLVVAG
jgi:hypothetical protein